MTQEHAEAVVITGLISKVFMKQWLKRRKILGFCETLLAELW